MQKAAFKIEELDCAEECNILRRALSSHPGIKEIDFDVLSNKMSLSYDSKQIDSERILVMIKSTGMTVRLWQDSEAEEIRSFWQKHSRLILCVASGLFLVLGFIIEVLGPSRVTDIGGFSPGYEQVPIAAIIFYLIAIVSGAWFVAPKALGSIKRLTPDMNVLMIVAVLGAIAIGQLFEGAAVTFLFALALLLESWSVDRARRAIGTLLDLSPKLARVKKNEGLVERNVEDVDIGETVLVRPGEKIPLDGEVTSGSSTVNQAPITGESMPVSKDVGDLVFAGTINEDGALEFLVQKSANDTTLARIIKMVQEARSRRADSEKWVDRFSRIYTPIMMVGAICLALLPPLFIGEPWMEWIYRGLVLLVIACPCALVISTPVSIVSALTAAARSGILIKGGIYLEEAAKLEALCFDKTGTITIGRPKVQRIVPLNNHSEDELLALAAALEMPSEHPLARAILEKADEKTIQYQTASNFKIFKGLGAEGDIEGQRYWIGSHRFMHEQKRKESEEAHSIAIELEEEGNTVIAIGDFSHICGLFSINDAPRPNIEKTLLTLKELGIEKLVMLTGDNQKTAETLAECVGIDTFFAELMPEDKVRKVEEIKQTHPIVAMIGDGVNDAPAMAASSFGIAMGAMGTDAAFETADIVLMNDDLSQIPWLIRHSRRALSIVKQNIYFALSVKALFIGLDFFGLATLWMAIMADTGASLLVVFNGLRLLRR